MRYIDVENWNRKKTYEWFKTFSNATYGFNVKMDVTQLVNHSKATNTSFFINMVYILVKSMNSVEEMRMRIVDGKPVVFDDVTPAYTVMTEAGTFENVRHGNYENYSTFYSVAQQKINKAKQTTTISAENYNPTDRWNEYYMTCTPWVDYEGMTHPIPDQIQSQCVPRVCWGKYRKDGERYYLTLNITVSHLLVDGHPLSKAFTAIQESLNNAEQILK